MSLLKRLVFRGAFCGQSFSFSRSGYCLVEGLLLQFVESMNVNEAAEVFAAVGALNCYPEVLLAALLPHVASL